MTVPVAKAAPIVARFAPNLRTRMGVVKTDSMMPKGCMAVL